MFELLGPLFFLAALMVALAVILACAFLIVAILEEAVKWVKDKCWGLRCWYDRKKKTDQR
jgi:hypothetical protein